MPMKKRDGRGSNATQAAAKQRKRAAPKRRGRRPQAATRRPSGGFAASWRGRCGKIEELQASADTDFLLGIPNRRGFERELARALAYIKRYRASGALIVLDVDRLKPINDAFGHAAGDQVLKAIVAVLTRRCAPPTWSAGSAATSSRCCCGISARPMRRPRRPRSKQTIDRLTFHFRRQHVTAGASAGVAMLGSHVGCGRALEEADSAMYVRKAQRRHEA